MPKIDPRDWDRLFRPNTPRRGGPLRVLANLLIVGAAFLLLGGGAAFAFQFGLQQVQVSATATSQAVATQNAIVLATRTARALETSLPASTAEVATPAPTLPLGNIVTSGNLRSEPLVVPETVVGQICIGDTVDVLEEQIVGGSIWYRVRVTQTGPDCDPSRVPVSTEGWVSTLLVDIASP